MKADIDILTARRIVKFGKEYKPAVLPDDLKRGRLGWCFDDSIIQLTDEKLRAKYRYVEGIARAFPHEPLKLHAWLTDGVHAFDPTWMGIGEAEAAGYSVGYYCGIEMDAIAVMHFMHVTEYQSVIANGYRNKKLARECLPKGFRITREAHKHSANPTHVLIGEQE